MLFFCAGLETHLADLEGDLMTLFAMRRSSHSAEFRLQVEEWVQSLQNLGKMIESNSQTE